MDDYKEEKMLRRMEIMDEQQEEKYVKIPIEKYREILRQIERALYDVEQIKREIKS